jgi:hypothetical protein
MLAGDRQNFLDAETKLMPAIGQVRRTPKVGVLRKRMLLVKLRSAVASGCHSTLIANPIRDARTLVRNTSQTPPSARQRECVLGGFGANYRDYGVRLRFSATARVSTLAE